MLHDSLGIGRVGRRLGRVWRRVWKWKVAMDRLGRGCGEEVGMGRAMDWWWEVRRGRVWEYSHGAWSWVPLWGRWGQLGVVLLFWWLLWL